MLILIGPPRELYNVFLYWPPGEQKRFYTLRVRMYARSITKSNLRKTGDLFHLINYIFTAIAKFPGN